MSNSPAQPTLRRPVKLGAGSPFGPSFAPVRGAERREAHRLGIRATRTEAFTSVPPTRPAFDLLNAGRLSALHRDVLSLAPFFRARSRMRDLAVAITHLADRSTSSTSTTADPGNRRGRTMTRPPKDPGCPGPWAPHPLHLRTSSGRTPLWHERDNQHYAFLFCPVNNKIKYKYLAASDPRSIDRYEGI